MKCYSLLIAAALAAALVQSAFGAAAPGAQQGQAVVKVVQGTASYTEVAGGQPIQLKPDQVLKAGNTIITGPASTVILDLGENGNALSVKSDSTLSIDTLTLQKTGVGNETAITTELDLKKGSIIGNVKKLSAASRYEVKTQNGVAGIRGTSFQIFAVGIFRCASGQLVVIARNLTTGQTVTVPVPAGRETVGGTPGGPRTNPMSGEARNTIVAETRIQIVVVPVGGGTGPTPGSGGPVFRKNGDRPVGLFDPENQNQTGRHDNELARLFALQAFKDATNSGLSLSAALVISNATLASYSDTRNNGFTPGQAGGVANSLQNAVIAAITNNPSLATNPTTFSNLVFTAVTNAVSTATNFPASNGSTDLTQNGLTPITIQ